MTTARDAIRASAFQSRKAKSQIVNFEGVDYEVRAPSVRARARILERGGVLEEVDSKGKKAKSKDVGALSIAAVIACTFVPGTDERVFDDGDFDSLLDAPVGSLVDALSTPAFDFLNTNKDTEKNG